MPIEIKIAKEEDREEWNKLVESSPHGTIFHTWKWLKIMEKHSWMNLIIKRSECKLYPLIGVKREKPIGVFPLFYYDNPLFKVVSSPPRRVEVHYLGPVLVDYDELKQSKKELIYIEFQKKVDEFVSSELKANFISIKSPPGLIDCRPFEWNGYEIEPRYNYIIDMKEGENYLWRQFSKGLRRSITAAEKEGVSMEEGSKKELIQIYEDYYKSFESQGLNLSFSKEYLLDIYDNFYPQNLKVFVARYHGEFAGGMIATCFRNIFSVWMGLIKTPLKNIPSNDLLQWETMKWAMDHRFKYYEIIWANTQRLNQFKSKCNPDLSIYFSATKNTSFFSKLLDISYMRILRPISTRKSKKK